MNPLSLVSPDRFCLWASSYAGRPAKVEKSDHATFCYRKSIVPPLSAYSFSMIFEFNFSFWLTFELEFLFWIQTCIFLGVGLWPLCGCQNFLQEKNSFPLPLPPFKRAIYPYQFIATFSTDKNDQNASLACGKAITTSDLSWGNGPYFTTTETTSIFLFPLALAPPPPSLPPPP